MKAVEQQIQDTGQVGKMTSKEKVLSVYPDAYVAHFNAGMAIKNEANNIFLSDDYTHDSEEDAWDDAASKLPSAPSPAEETARITLSSRPPTQREIERGQELAKQHGLLADAVPDTLYHAERLKFEQWYAANRMQLYMHLDVRLRMAIEDTARAAWFSGMESGSVVAAPIAPAAVSEEQRMLDARSQFAKPSAEGDGWIAVTPETMPQVGLIVDVYQLYGWAKWTGTEWIAVDRCGNESCLMWTPKYWVYRPLPAPPSGQGEKR